MNVCDYCGARMEGGGQGIMDWCPNGCDYQAAQFASRVAAEEEAAREQVRMANMEAIERMAGEYDGPRLKSPRDQGRELRDAAELARLCSLDLGHEILPEEVRLALLTGECPERLNEREKRDMQATLIKEMLV